MRSTLLQCASRLPSAPSSLRVASAVRSVGTQPSSNSSSTPAPPPAAAPRTDAPGKTTHFGFKTVREEEKEDLGESVHLKAGLGGCLGPGRAVSMVSGGRLT